MEAKETKQMAGMETEEACCRTERTPAEQRNCLPALRRWKGRSGAYRKWWKPAYCPDILMQVSAVSNALNSFNKLLLASHIRGCVSDDIREGRDGKVDELCTMLQN